ncbi:hypothetical protein CsSME_00035243 [Camellia sinensis var. sinensis]
MVYESIIEATENFSTKYCVGEGGCGTVYKADLTTDQVVAVKKLHISSDGDLANLKGYTSEISTLTKIRHRNIVELYGYCSHQRHSFLVYEFLEGGSLGKILSTEDHALYFDWIKRVNVVKDVANALSYMHHECSPAIIHRDISSKNVLLDLESVAHISDFGTARFLKPDSSNWTSFAGTFGYTAPGDLIYSLSSSSSSSSSTSTAHGILLKDLDRRGWFGLARLFQTFELSFFRSIVFCISESEDNFLITQEKEWKIGRLKSWYWTNESVSLRFLAFYTWQRQIIGPPQLFI